MSPLQYVKPSSPYNEKREKRDLAIARPKLRAICVYYYMSLLTKLGRETSQKERPTSLAQRREMPANKLFSNAHAPLMLRHFFASQIGTRVCQLGRIVAKVSKCLIVKGLRPIPYCQIGVPKWRPPHRRHEEMGARRSALISVFWKHVAHECVSLGMSHFGTCDSLCCILETGNSQRFKNRCAIFFLAKNLLHFSICACHPCAGAMLIFSVSFEF